jgi:hypothetical protein
MGLQPTSPVVAEKWPVWQFLSWTFASRKAKIDDWFLNVKPIANRIAQVSGHWSQRNVFKLRNVLLSCLAINQIPNCE